MAALVGGVAARVRDDDDERRGRGIDRSAGATGAARVDILRTTLAPRSRRWPEFDADTDEAQLRTLGAAFVDQHALQFGTGCDGDPDPRARVGHS